MSDIEIIESPSSTVIEIITSGAKGDTGATGAPGANGPTDVLDPASAITAALVQRYNRKSRIVVGASNADYATLAAALAVAVSGDEIFLRPGTHALSGANSVPAGVTIVGGTPGMGSGVAVLDGSYNTTISALTLNAGCALRNIHVKNSHANGGSGVVSVAADVRGAGVSITGCTFSGPWGQAILGYQSTDIRVADCTFDSIGMSSGVSTPGDGVNLYGVNGAIVSNCQFRDLKQNAIYVNANSKNVTIVGNTVRGGCEGMQIRVGCSSVTVTGNVFDIKGVTGVYSVGIIVQTQCTDIVISNNVLRTTAGTATPVAAIMVDDRCNRVAIEGNSIQGAGFAKGILVGTTGAGGTESINTIINGNIIDSCAGIGIHVAASENLVVISNNRLVSGSNKGIYCQATRAVISGNLVTSCAGTNGIEITGSFCAVTGNVVTNVTAGAGILISGSDNTITGNMCTGNNTYGISETSNTNLIIGNNCGGNSHATIDILRTGAASKLAYNIGRYTQFGAA